MSVLMGLTDWFRCYLVAVIWSTVFSRVCSVLQELGSSSATENRDFLVEFEVYLNYA